MSGMSKKVGRVLVVAAALVVTAAVLGLARNSLSAQPLPLSGASPAAVSYLETGDDVVQAQRLQDAVLIDARTAQEYAQDHIKGALSVPYSEREQSLAMLVETIPSSTLIIAYCDEGCDSAPRLASWLQGKGWRRAAVFRGGMSQWRQADLPLSQGEAP
jgi:rhodanese-related sulfurtransferase